MNNKSFTKLIIISIILFFLAFISYLIQPKYETSIKSGEIIFSEIKGKLNDINEINIDNNKKKISIIKDNDSWFMKSKSNYKVKSEIVRKNLIQISELRFQEMKTNDESLYSRLDLDFPNNEENNSRYISILFNDGKSIEFVLGKRRKNSVYIKKIKDKETWLTKGNLDMSILEKDWLETNIFNLDYKNIKDISINHLEKKDSFTLTKDTNNENLLINNLNKDQLPKSDLIANFLGYFFKNLSFDNVQKRISNIDENIILKVIFKLQDETVIEAVFFNIEKDKWVNFQIENNLIEKLYNNKSVFIKDINNWSFKLPSAKYSITDTKLEDLLVED